MANTQDIIDRLASHAMSTGLFDSVNTHEPKNSPGRGIRCAIWCDMIVPVASQSGLAATTGRIDFFVRLYSNMMQEPQDMIDPNLINAVDVLMSAYSGDFTLGGTIKKVDLLGSSPGHPLSAQSGYINIDNRVYRVMTIRCPVIVNDIWNQSE